MQQVEEALAEQERSERRLGEILVERGLTERALAKALAEQHGLEFIDLGDVEPEERATALLRVTGDNWSSADRRSFA